MYVAMLTRLCALHCFVRNEQGDSHCIIVAHMTIINADCLWRSGALLAKSEAQCVVYLRKQHLI